MTAAVSALSKEYVRVAVSAKENGVAVNPVSDTVSMAFMPTDTSPGISDWQGASWETDTTTVPTTYYARCLIGPAAGTITLSPGQYWVWVKLTDSPEAPVFKSGQLSVY